MTEGELIEIENRMLAAIRFRARLRRLKDDDADELYQSYGQLDLIAEDQRRLVALVRSNLSTK